MSENRASQRVVGQTKDAGFQIGARRTFSVPPQQAWDLLTSTEGTALWLGETPGLRWEKGEKYQTRAGARGEIRVVNPGGHLRLTWQPEGWEKASTLQVRVIPNGEKTTISFHQEHLKNAVVREQMRARWKSALDELGKLFQEE